MDSVSPEKRSQVMASVRSRDTRPELAVRTLFHKLGFRFRLRGKGLPCKPDLVLPRYRVAVFVHGCFWHRHQGCPNTRTPKSRVEFWTEKFETNVRRDRENLLALEALGWHYFVIWECELKDVSALQARILGYFEGLGRCDRSSCSQGRED